MSIFLHSTVYMTGYLYRIILVTYLPYTVRMLNLINTKYQILPDVVYACVILPGKSFSKPLEQNSLVDFQILFRCVQYSL